MRVGILAGRYVREFLMEKSIFLLEDEHGHDSEIVIEKRGQLSLFKQWQDPYLLRGINMSSQSIDLPLILGPFMAYSFPGAGTSTRSFG